jgi:hypothetical protein
VLRLQDRLEIRAEELVRARVLTLISITISAVAAGSILTALNAGRGGALTRDHS